MKNSNFQTQIINLMQNLTLDNLESLVQTIDQDLYLDTGERVSVLSPADYISVIKETKYNICIGEIVYSNITLYMPLFNNLETLISLLDQVDDNYIIHIDYNTTFNMTIYFLDDTESGDYDDLQTFSCDDIQDLISTIKRETML